MAARRGKAQAKRNPRSGGGVPGWAWLVAGLLIGVALILAAPRFLKSDAADGFFRPTPNPDARPAPAASTEEDDAIVPDATAPAATAGDDAGEGKPKATTYDFYTLLPGEEVALSDAELAASEKAEAERQAQEQAKAEQARAQAAEQADAGGDAAADASAATPAAATPDAARAEATEPARYVLQAGAFAASGDAEAIKAKIALLGLTARVESAQVGAKTMYRVRLGPYGTAGELAEAKRKLAVGGLPALAIRAK